MTGASRVDFAIHCATPGDMMTPRYGKSVAVTLYIDAQLNPHVMQATQWSV